MTRGGQAMRVHHAAAPPRCPAAPETRHGERAPTSASNTAKRAGRPCSHLHTCHAPQQPAAKASTAISNSSAGIGVTTPTVCRPISRYRGGGGDGAASPPGRGARQHLALEGHAALESQGQSLRAYPRAVADRAREMLRELEGDDFGNPQLARACQQALIQRQAALPAPHDARDSQSSRRATSLHSRLPRRRCTACIAGNADETGDQRSRPRATPHQGHVTPPRRAARRRSPATAPTPAAWPACDDRNVAMAGRRR